MTRTGTGNAASRRGLAKRRALPRHSRLQRRRGLSVPLVMLCLFLGTALVGQWMRLSLVGVQRARGAEDRQQAVWLAESALGRAAARLHAGGEYDGETWNAGPLGGAAAGSVEIGVERVADDPRARRVRARAVVTHGATERQQVTRQAVVRLPERGEK